MFFQFLAFLFKSLVILAKALPCSFHLFIILVISLIIYYVFELCIVYLVKSSLLGSARLTGCLCLLRPALRPGSTGQLVSYVVLSKHHVLVVLDTSYWTGNFFSAAIFLATKDFANF